MVRLLCLATLLVAGTAFADAQRFRLTWRGDPATTMVIGWDQVSGVEPRVRLSRVGATESPRLIAPHRVVESLEMKTHFVRITGLKPDTAYAVRVVDTEGESRRLWFRTAPARGVPFSLVVGGDSRNNREPRRRGNRAVAKLRPLAVVFGGDYTAWDTAAQWREWLDDWQETISPDGRIYPVLAGRGNHDGAQVMADVWDWKNPDTYGAWSLGDRLRVYVLNTEVPPGGEQRAWLAKDLARHACVPFKMALYHRPIRPHAHRKREGQAQYTHWAGLFYQAQMSLVVECDTHVVKRTWPLRPALEGEEGFIRDHRTGTVYIGEGGWGAPLREPDDAKTWTRAVARFNQVTWLHVWPDRMEVRTLMTDAIDEMGSVDIAAPLKMPHTLPLWSPKSGAVVTIRPPIDRPADCPPL
jgi:hypothetical protein